ncbi:hypothetical protein [Stenotrophomonas phage BUCT603]|nr:hypothetical protein [Stenotrophomonas phage BUCT603]
MSRDAAHAAGLTEHEVHLLRALQNRKPGMLGNRVDWDDDKRPPFHETLINLATHKMVVFSPGQNGFVLTNGGAYALAAYERAVQK